MYIAKMDIQNVKGIAGFVWELDSRDSRAGWHVFLGDNGSGKSTLLKACALALLGPKNAMGLRLSWGEWVRHGKAEAGISLVVERDPALDKMSVGRPSKESQNKIITCGVKISHSGLEAKQDKPSLYGSIWGDGGWFSASFGPYRRFSGGSKEYEKLFYSMPKLASHLSIFGEDVALSETLSWLRELHYAQLDDEKRGLAGSQSGLFLVQFKRFINQEGFLPNGSMLEEISPKGVIFRDPNGAPIDILALSDGFRSILSMTLELIRQLVRVFGPEQVFSEDGSKIIPPGVVIIDEIDVHLHPRWQRTIGPWLTNHFPNLQFLVSTHSPLVCQGAINGTITRLPSPGSDDNGGRVTGDALNRLLYGDILEALGSGAFGENVDRSEFAQTLFKELARLNVRARKHSLDEADAARRLDLSRKFTIHPGFLEGASNA